MSESTKNNVGRMVIIDVDICDIEMDPSGLDSALKLHGKHPDAKLFGIRIGYRTADAIVGAIEDTAMIGQFEKFHTFLSISTRIEVY